MCEVCLSNECAFDALALANQAVDVTIAEDQSTSSNVVDAVQALLTSYTWSQGTITFGFSESASEYDPAATAYDEELGYLPLSSAGTDMVRASFAAWTGIISTALVEAASGEDILVGGSSYPTTAWAYLPGTQAAGGDGDIWIGVDKSYNALFASETAENYIGSYEYLVSMHEIGHALGLKHPHTTYGTDTTVMATEFDSLEYTIMSYRSYEGGSIGGYTVQPGNYPQSLMILDIAAIQELYGADFTTNAGNTTYYFDPATGEMFIDNVSQGIPTANVVFRTLWDGNGTDTIDLSNYTTSMQANLSAGGGIVFDTDNNLQLAQLGATSGVMNYASANIYFALLYQDDTRSLIENVTTGAGDDDILGNVLANDIIAGAGADTLTGDAGADTLTGGDGIDTFTDAFANLSDDVITDFDIASGDMLIVSDGDTVDLSAVYDVSTGLLTLTRGAAVISLTVTLDATLYTGLVLSDVDDGVLISFGAGEASEPVIVIDDVVTQNGTSADDVMVGGNNDDQFLFRDGTDIATGNEGSDSFIADWRYVQDGDSYTITDLDFSEGDALTIRLYEGKSYVIDSLSKLETFIAVSTVASVVSATETVLTLYASDNTKVADLTLTGIIASASSGPSEEVEEPAVPDTDPDTVDDAITQNGTDADDVMVGGNNDDQFLFRDGTDIATGNEGADNFVIDWRYVSDGDSYTITDLDFSEGDMLIVRQLGYVSYTISSDMVMTSFMNQSYVTTTIDGTQTVMTIDDSAGKAVTLTLGDAEIADSGDDAETDNENQSDDTDNGPLDDVVTQNGTSTDDVMVGGNNDDQFLLRDGNDIATGNDGADSFIADWRYVKDGDSYTITDLDFSEGDALTIRLYEGKSYVISEQSKLNDFVALNIVSSVMSGTSQVLTIADADGKTISLTLDDPSLSITDAATTYDDFLF